MIERQGSHSREDEFFSSRRVVVTGMGMVTPLGLDVESSWQRLIAGESGFSSIAFEHVHASVFGEISDFNPEAAFEGFINTKELRRIPRATQFTLAASLEALRHAGLLTDDSKLSEGIEANRVGVQIGTGMGSAARFIRVDEGLKGSGKILPTEIFNVLIERVSTVPSIKFGLKGPNETPSAACATGNIAIAGGYKEILLNEADIMLVGGVEASLNQASVKMFDAMPAISREEDPDRASRPFDVNRDGFVFSEGVGVLVLESEGHAKARGVPILGYVAGFGNTSDGYHDTEPSGEGAKRAMRRGLRYIPEESQSFYINAHGTATPTGDPVEIQAIRESFEDKGEFIVSSTKGATGHTLGAAGAIEAIFCLKSLETNIVPPTIHHEETMPEAQGINIVPNAAQEQKVDVVVNNSFGFGGINSVTVFTRE